MEDLNVPTEKSKWLSKTLWVQVAALVAYIVPATREFIQGHLLETGSAWAGINIVLRFLTKDKIQLF